MILEYNRPKTIDEALSLLNRAEPVTLPLGGGTVLSHPNQDRYAVVDLQSLGLNQIEAQGNQLSIGAAATLQSLYDVSQLQPALKEAIARDTTYNLRQTATVAGRLVTSQGNSPFAVAMLALDAGLVWLPGETTVDLGDYLPVRGSWTGGKLISHIRIPLNVGLKYEYVARTPADQPLICAAMAEWQSGRRRIVIGGPGSSPRLVLDGEGDRGMEEMILNAYSHYNTSTSIDKNYLEETSRILVRRLLAGSPDIKK